MTHVINLYGGPGTGKSTNAALVFGKLKVAGITAELAHEYAKELTWEDRLNVLGFQPYVMGKQMWRIQRLLGKVQVIVTDSPVMLGAIYAPDSMDQSWVDFLYSVHQGWNTVDIFLKRNTHAHPYVEDGRNQNEVEARLLDDKVRHMLYAYEIPHSVVAVQTEEKTADHIVGQIKERLDA